MINGILHQRLQRQLADHGSFAAFIHADIASYDMVVPHILNDQIIPHMLDLHLQRNDIVPPAQTDPIVPCKRFYQRRDLMIPIRHCLPVDTVQRIIQKMWLYLAAQGVILRHFVQIPGLIHFFYQFGVAVYYIFQIAGHRIEGTGKITDFIVLLNGHLHGQVAGLNDFHGVNNMV